MRSDETLPNEARAYAVANERGLDPVTEEASQHIAGRSAEAGASRRVGLPVSCEPSGPKLTWEQIQVILAEEDREHLVRLGLLDAGD